MIVALLDSGFGLLPTAARVAELRPELDLLLMMDPDGAPWGPKPAAWTVDRVVSTALSAVDRGAAVVVIPCNTASVTALVQTRAALGPSVPVIGTVPAIKPAAAECDSFAVWATAATTASSYQANLIEQFAGHRSVSAIACHGLAEAIDRGDTAAIDASIDDSVARTPADASGIVLGCTHYPLVVDRIASRLPSHVRLYDSAPAVAAQTLRRIDELGRDHEMAGQVGCGTVTVVLSGRPGVLPAGAAEFAAGRVLGAAGRPEAGRESAGRPEAGRDPAGRPEAGLESAALTRPHS